MPLSSDASKMRSSMISQYGKKKGTSIFWATINKKGLDEKKNFSKQEAVQKLDVLDADKRNKLPDEQFAAPKEKKLPINDRKHIHNAMARWNQTEGIDKPAAKERICRAAKKHGMQSDFCSSAGKSEATTGIMMPVGTPGLMYPALSLFDEASSEMEADSEQMHKEEYVILEEECMQIEKKEGLKLDELMDAEIIAVLEDIPLKMPPDNDFDPSDMFGEATKPTEASDVNRILGNHDDCVMEEGEEEKWSKSISYEFKTDGRTPEEVKEMKEYGYVEREEAKQIPTALRPFGYFCGGCGFFERKPGTMPQNPSEDDGICHKYNFRDRGYGCCDGFVPKDEMDEYEE